MKPGVFVGKDGNTYRWLGDSRGYVMLQMWSDRLDDWVTSPMNPEDWPDAEAALDAYTSSWLLSPKLFLWVALTAGSSWSYGATIFARQRFAGRSMVMPPIRVRVMSRCLLLPPIRRVLRTA